MCEPWIGFWDQFEPPNPPVPSSVLIQWHYGARDFPGFAPFATVTVNADSTGPVNLAPGFVDVPFSFDNSLEIIMNGAGGSYGPGSTNGAGFGAFLTATITSPTRNLVGSLASASGGATFPFYFTSLTQTAAPLWADPNTLMYTSYPTFSEMQDLTDALTAGTFNMGIDVDIPIEGEVTAFDGFTGRVLILV
jgi:hypothetical protein